MLMATETAPGAEGAAFGEILIAAGMAGMVMLAFGWVVLRERSGHATAVGRLADRVAVIDGLPRWVGLPSYLLVISLLTAGFGVWWDVPIHMQNGRDEGPLANPSHYFIFFGILGFLHSGILSMALARDPLPRGAVRLSPTWRVPRGSLVALGAGLIALVGFPADDVWHRLFGQDVTEWGPTHVMMIGGAVTCILAVPLLYAEAHQVGAPGTRTRIGRLRGAIQLSLCIIPMAFLMEFDLGVPQYPAATQFIIAGFLMGWVFCAVRLWYGPGGALVAGATYIVIHLFLWASVALIPDVLTARFLLFLPGAILVELVALVADPRRRPVRFGVACGVLIGTVGLAAEWVWTGFFMPLPQPLPPSTLPLMLTVGTLAAVGGGLLAAWHVAHLHAVAGDATFPEPRPEAPASMWRRQGAGLAGIGVFVVLMAAFAPPADGPAMEATVSFSDVERADGSAAPCAGGEAECLSRVTVQVSPADALDDAAWFYGLAWQGRGTEGATDVPQDPTSGAPGVVRVVLEPTGAPGEFRSVEPLPLYGDWKAMLRVHLLPRAMVAAPLHAPDDPAITSPRGREIVVADGEVVPFVPEKQFLQREIKDDIPGWLNTAAYAVVIGSWLVLIWFYGWCHASAAAAAAARRRPESAASVQI